jgi:hypothetical protein
MQTVMTACSAMVWKFAVEAAFARQEHPFPATMGLPAQWTLVMKRRIPAITYPMMGSARTACSAMEWKPAMLLKVA